MNDHQDSFSDGLSTPTYGEQPRPGWFKRNWLWFVPTIILLPIFCCCGGPIGLVWFSLGKVLDIVPYKDSVAFIEQDADVQNALGTPIDAPKGFMDLVTMMQNGGQFNFNQNNSQMQFDAEIPVSGPNGSGKLLLEAESADGVAWTYTIREVHVDSTGEVIDLLPSGSASPAPADDETESDAEPETE